MIQSENPSFMFRAFLYLLQSTSLQRCRVYQGILRYHVTGASHNTLSIWSIINRLNPAASLLITPLSLCFLICEMELYKLLYGIVRVV